MRWTRTEAGDYVSDCGTLRIEPEYWGRAQISAWALKMKRFDGKWVRVGQEDTLRQAKKAATYYGAESST